MNPAEKRILVAEDEDALRDMFVTVLEDEEYQVDSVANGKDALGLLSKNKYDILATDLYMPGMNGAELIKQCKQMAPEVKIILLSGGGKELEAEHGKARVKFQGENVETDIFIKKPCNLVDLFSFIESLLDN